jgi:cation transporter-like permease
MKSSSRNRRRRQQQQHHQRQPLILWTTILILSSLGKNNQNIASAINHRSNNPTTTTTTTTIPSSSPSSYYSQRKYSSSSSFDKIFTRSIMAPKAAVNVSSSSSSSSSSVLNELKDTIQRQAQEIESLKQQLKSTSTTTSINKGSHQAISHGGGGGGHGGGAEPSPEEVASYLHDPFYRVSMQRVGWLGLFLTSLSGTALIMNVFEHTLAKHIELAYFVPLLAGHGGNTGGQTVGTVLSALSTGTVQPKDAPRIVLKEALGGAMSGTILSSIVAPLAYHVLGLSFHVALVLFFTLPLVSMIAATLGSLIPFACVFVGLEPSVIAAPAMTSIVDVTGLMSYFLIANYIFRLYGLEL